MHVPCAMPYAPCACAICVVPCAICSCAQCTVLGTACTGTPASPACLSLRASCAVCCTIGAPSACAAWCFALLVVLCAACAHVSTCPACPVHPASLDTASGGTEGGGGAEFAWGRDKGFPPPCAIRAAEMLPNISCGPRAAPRGGGGVSPVAAKRSRLALRARRGAGTPSHSAEGAGRVSPRGSDLQGRCVGLCGVWSAADATWACPTHADSVFASACRTSSANTCRPGPRRCRGGRVSRRPVPCVSRAAATADSPAQLQAAAARWRAVLLTLYSH